MPFMNRPFARRALSAVALLLLLAMMPSLAACEVNLPPLGGTMPPSSETSAGSSEPATTPESSVGLTSISIENGSSLTLAVGSSILLTTDADESYDHLLQWSASSDVVSVSSLGYVVANRVGDATVTVRCGNVGSMILITVVEETAILPPDTGASPDSTPDTTPETAPETNTPPDKEDNETRGPIPEELGSPDDYKPAASYEEALDRSSRGELSGYLWLMDQEPNIDPNRPMKDGKYIRNNEAYFADANTYVVVDSVGREVFRVYRGGGYITLEEVAAYLYAFGDIPANYVSNKVTNVGTNMWGEYLRGNHSKFSGSTSKYPYEPELPRISGCGGDLQYYEIDIGTTGTDCDPGYAVRPYNDGSKITRGAARIVYARFDANGNKVIDPEEKYIFYTYNHYNDFREYLNYYNGWGEMFGNITGGGTLSSKTDYNPTDYVPSILSPLPDKRRTTTILRVDLWSRNDRFAA